MSKKKRRFFTCFRGATAYECQIGPIYFYWMHLEGNYWKWKPWRRFRTGWDSEWLIEHR